MATSVPTAGAWQADPQLQQLMLAYVAKPHTPQSRGDVAGPEYTAFRQYIDQNRQRLGIPAGYYPDSATGGQTLKKDEGIPWKTEAAIGAGMVAAPFVLPAVGAGSAATQAATGAASAAPGVGATGAGIVTGAAEGLPAVTGGGMNWLDALLYGGKTLTSVIGSRSQANAATDAAAIQAASADKALALTKSIYDTTRGDLAPYDAAGQGAVVKLGAKLGVTPAPQAQPMATLRAPDGSTRQFPAAQADAVIQRSNGQLQRVA